MSENAETVYVVDDDSSVRRSLRRLLLAAGLNCEAFGSAAEFLAQHRPEMTGCVVVDFQMPQLTGLELQAALNHRDNALSIVFLTGQGDIQTSVTAMKAGAMDFLTKPVPEGPLLEAIQLAFERSRATHAQRARLATLRNMFGRLTPRETDVLRLIVRGYLNKQTAAELGTVEKTIKVHRARVMEKLEVGSVAELVRMVERSDFFNEPDVPQE